MILADEPTPAPDSHRGRQVTELFRSVARMVRDPPVQLSCRLGVNDMLHAIRGMGGT